MPAMAPPPEDAVVGAIIDALGANNTTVARGALKQLLLGELKTAIPDAQTTGLAAKAILKKPSEKEEEMLLRTRRIQRSCTRRRQPGDDRDFGGDRREHSADVRPRWSVFHAKGCFPEHRKVVIDAVLKPEPVNLPAQARLFHSGKIDKSTKADLDRNSRGSARP